MPARSARRPRAAARRTVRPGGRWRVALAVALLAAAVAAVLVTRRWHPPEARPQADSAESTLLALAERYGCSRDRIVVEPLAGERGGHEVTLHAPPSFDVAGFVLAVEAAAHNRGERVEALPLAEGGGYGLARLEGRLAGEPVRVVVLGERARRRPARRPNATHPPRLAVLLDDAGNSLAAVAEIERLPVAVAVAVLPNAAQSSAVARALGAGKREVLLHMPMEPQPGAAPGPGPGGLEVGQSPEEVRARLDAALSVVATARGLNNHMGSRATADRRLMRLLMAELRARGLYFVDSRTTPDSVAFQVAGQVGVRAAERDVFLDVVAEPLAIRRALERAISEARAAGSALAIGHVHPVTIDTLAVELPRLEGTGVRLVPPSQLLVPPR